MSSLESLWAARDIFFSGIGVSVLLIGLCLAISIPLSALTHVVLQECAPGFARLVRLTLDTIRCIPFLLLAYVAYYGLPELGLRMDAFWVGLLALVVYHSAYFVEIFRSSMQSVPAETLIAADAFGFNRFQRYRRIVFPQLFSIASPVLANQAVIVIKDSALLMIITVQEITFAANFVSANQFSPFAPFLFAMLLYWLMSLITDRLIGRLAHRPR